MRVYRMEGNQAERRRKEQDQDPGRKEQFRSASEPREVLGTGVATPFLGRY